MKKLFSTVLSMALIGAMTVSAMAATAIDGEGALSASGKTEGDYTIGVRGVYEQGTEDTAVVSVDIAWDNMEFVYNKGFIGTWNPDTHSYERGTPGSWTTDKKKVTVSNHSNCIVKAAFTFQKGTGVTTDGKFYGGESDASGEMTYTLVDSDKQSFVLDSAEGTSTENPPKGQLYFGVEGDGITENQSLGTVEVVISKAAAYQVTTEQQLFTACTNGGYVQLMNDIDMDTSLLVLDKPVVLDLNGYTLSNGDLDYALASVVAVGEDVSATVKNGTVESKNTIFGFSIMNEGNLTVTDCILKTPSYASVYNYNHIVLKNCDLQSKPNTDSIYNSNMYNRNAVLELSGTIHMTGDIGREDNPQDGGTYTITTVAKAGTYNFDPTAYVDTELYTVTPDNGEDPTAWTVALK